MRPGIDDNDYNIKMRKVREFLDEGDKVKVTMRFRGREMAHQHLAMDILEKVKTEIVRHRQGRADAQARRPADDHGDGAAEVARMAAAAHLRAQTWRDSTRAARTAAAPNCSAWCGCTRLSWRAPTRLPALEPW